MGETTPKGRLRRIWQAAIAVLVLVFAVAAFRYFWFDPNVEIQDISWLQKASVEEVRSAAHRVLFWRWGNHHDACILLTRVGNQDSVSYLERAIRRLEAEPFDPDAPEEAPCVPCTLSHCKRALELSRDRP
jgi:hypothetical protein